MDKEVGLVEVVKRLTSADGIGVVDGNVIIGTSAVLSGEWVRVGWIVNCKVSVRGGDRGEGSFVVGLEDLLEGRVGVEL